MNKLTSTLFLTCLLALGTTMVAQAQAHSHSKAAKATEEHNDVTQPKILYGVQVVEIEVTPTGYSVDKIALQAGLPARLIFTRTKDGGCTNTVQVPAFGVEPVALPLNEAVAVDFTPTDTGTFTFACSMDMVKGALLVRTSE